MLKELRDIYGDGFNGIFISDSGELFTNRVKQEMRKMACYEDKKGYIYCKIYDTMKQKYKHISLHRTVAIAFIPNPDNKETVNHKDKIKSHCWSDNLEWMTLKENVKHANNGVRNNKNCELWKDGVFIDSFESRNKASKFACEHFGVGKHSIQKYGKSHGCEIIVRCND